MSPRKTAADRRLVRTAAQALGRRGGSVNSPAQQAAARANGARGGRPRKTPTPATAGDVAYPAFAGDLLGDVLRRLSRAALSVEHAARLPEQPVSVGDAVRSMHRDLVLALSDVDTARDQLGAAIAQLGRT